MIMEPYQQFLEYIVKAIVEFPDDMKIVASSDDMGVLLTLSVHRDDMGKVIGRAGATAKSIRTVLRTVGMRYNARVSLKIEEPAEVQMASPPADIREIIDDLKTP